MISHFLFLQDNIGAFDRSQPLPEGGELEQSDGTAWMGFYCVFMIKIALELAEDDLSYEDIASKFFEHFVAISRKTIYSLSISEIRYELMMD